MPLKLIYPKAVSTPPLPGHLPFICSSTLRTHLAPRHPHPADKKTVTVHPLKIFSGTALTHIAMSLEVQDPQLREYSIFMEIISNRTHLPNLSHNVCYVTIFAYCPLEILRKVAMW